MYRNLEMRGNTEQEQDQAVVIMRDGVDKGGLGADPEVKH